jgi:hypothetical protein
MPPLIWGTVRIGADLPRPDLLEVPLCIGCGGLLDAIVDRCLLCDGCWVWVVGVGEIW